MAEVSFEGIKMLSFKYIDELSWPVLEVVLATLLDNQKHIVQAEVLPI